MERSKELFCLNAIEAVLKREFPEQWYSLTGFSEDAVCLEKTGEDTWSVYYGSRGSRKELEICDNIASACIMIIRKLSNDPDTEKRIIDDFIEHIIVKE